MKTLTLAKPTSANVATACRLIDESVTCYDTSHASDWPRYGASSTDLVKIDDAELAYASSRRSAVQGSTGIAQWYACEPNTLV